MAKFREKIKARELRHKGESIKEIAKKLKVSKGSVSLWCRDIELTFKQIQKLHEHMVKRSYIGRLKGARTQYKRRLERIKKYKRIGASRLKNFSKKDFLIAGIALYWGEGAKTCCMVGISNSDPVVIRFMIQWFKEVWYIPKNRFTLHVLINQVHKKRLTKVVNYWSRLTGMPKSQFYKTTLIKAKNKKVYKNFSEHYGTLMLRVKKPHLLHHQIMGLIEKMGELGIRFES